MIEPTNYAAELERSRDQWTAQGLPTPDVVLVAGSGLSGDFGETLVPARNLTEILPFEAAGIEGHALSLEVLRSGEGEAATTTLYYRGRLHAYQGFTAAQVVFPMRFAAHLGARTAIITNAAGGMYPGVRAGDLALIEDHLNLTGLNPLRGALPSEWGPQFPDMSDAYDPGLRAVAREIAGTLGIELQASVYAGVLGPSYETPAEIRAFAGMGAGLVGMSTVLEVIAARHMGLRCLGVSLVTNPAAGTSDEVLRHEDVLEIGKSAAARVEQLIAGLLASGRLLARANGG